jgi:hypothetical protein
LETGVDGQGLEYFQAYGKENRGSGQKDAVLDSNAECIDGSKSCAGND